MKREKLKIKKERTEADCFCFFLLPFSFFISAE